MIRSLTCSKFPSGPLSHSEENPMSLHSYTHPCSPPDRISYHSSRTLSTPTTLASLLFLEHTTQKSGSGALALPFTRSTVLPDIYVAGSLTRFRCLLEHHVFREAVLTLLYEHTCVGWPRRPPSLCKPSLLLDFA